MRTIFFGYKLFSISLRKFLQDDCFTLALSISFVFLLSIIPFSTLSLLIVDLMQRVFFPAANWSGKISTMLADGITQIIPFVSKDWIQAHLIHPEAYGSFKTINFMMLPIISGLIFKTLETSYRKIFQLPTRHLLLGQAIYVSMSIFAVLLFFISNFTWIVLSTSVPYFLRILHHTPYWQHLVQLAAIYTKAPPINWLSMLVLIGFYLVSVRLFLNVKIKWRHQLPAGFIFCLLWMLAREFFRLYIRHISEVNLLYGSLSSVIVILMWIFYSAIALLFSIEFMNVLHSDNRPQRWWLVRGYGS